MTYIDVKRFHSHPRISPSPSPSRLPLSAEVDAVLHPDTQEPVPLLFRMSMFMPANLPVTAGMLLSGTVRPWGGRGRGAEGRGNGAGAKRRQL
jgi:hypothetical protein